MIANLFGATEIEGGFPHSEIFGSKPVRGSPKLIAAYHVLHRLSAPRHPPDTLMALDCSHRQSAFDIWDPSFKGSQGVPQSANCGRTPNGAKRPVLLQTHPGVLAVKLEPTTGARRVGFKDKTHAAPGLTAPHDSLAPSGPRPNALPLHDVRYRAAAARPGPPLNFPRPGSKSAAACAARARSGPRN